MTLDDGSFVDEREVATDRYIGYDVKNTCKEMIFRLSVRRLSDHGLGFPDYG